MNRERAQVLVEAVAVVPACLMGALALVDCGILVRDRVAVAQAATRAAEARLVGAPVAAAARGALPASLRRTAQVTVDGDRVVVRATSRTALTRIAGIHARHRSTVELEGTR